MARDRRTRDLIGLRRPRVRLRLVASTSCTPAPSRDDVLETWSTLAGLAEATSRIELIGAIKPLLFQSLVFAKLAGNIAEIAEGRLSINVVSGWFLPELGTRYRVPGTTTATSTPGSGCRP